MKQGDLLPEGSGRKKESGVGGWGVGVVEVQGTEEESRCHTGGGSYLRGEKSPQALANKCLARNVSLLGLQWG